MAVGVILDDEELLHVAIKGLPKEFSAFRSVRDHAPGPFL